jgi:membrane-bound serine protease (ClpP class)
VVDVIAADLPQLLDKLQGRKVKMPDGEVVLDTAGATASHYAPDWRARLLAAITDPSIALILMMIGIYGLFFEFTSPGFGVAGVLGAICLLLGMYALQMLPVNYAGLALILLGIAFMMAEAFFPGFGVLGLGGIAAFVAGAIILIDTELPGFGIPLELIVAVAVTSALLLGLVGGLALKARRRRVVSGDEDLIGGSGEMVADAMVENAMMANADLAHAQCQGWARVHGETWRVCAATPLHRGQKVRVLSRDGLVLRVEPLTE